MNEIYRIPKTNILEFPNKKYKITNGSYHIEKNSAYLFKDIIEKKKYLLKPVLCKDIDFRCKKCFFSKYILEADTICKVSCIEYLEDVGYYFEEAPMYEKLFLGIGD